MPPETDRLEALLARLAPALDAGAVLRGDAVGPAYARDGEPFDGARPALVLRPRDTAQVAAILAAATALGQPVVVQGGRTGLTGGARPRPGEVALATERMAAIGRPDPLTQTITAGAGAPLEAVQQAARAAGMMLGVDLGARGSATIGGNIATNAGGIRVLRYGMFREQVAGLEAVLADGTVVGGLDRPPKDNAGPDLRQLFIGAEGVLGVVTRARLRLHPAPAHEAVALVALASLGAALAVLARLRAALPGRVSAFEVIDPALYAATLAHHAIAPPLPAGAGFYALVEIQSDRDEAGPFETALMAAIEDGLAQDAVIAGSGREVAQLWRIRDGVSEYLFSRPGMTGHDVGLPLARLEEGLAAIRAALAAADPRAGLMVFGHAGDGNLHVMVQTADPGATGPAVLRAVAKAGGTISAEHGIGTDKAPWLHLVRSAGELAAIARLKAAFDPAGVLNPGRILQADRTTEKTTDKMTDQTESAGNG
ncbi:FAD-binding oxidoreductase [Frigidibacter sp. MR17.24]|uniref:FAD-binding oxidoreductase n=1 Tax=Frigidibacter sp. MR17.24 TaxID=3127345 RepID=UPI003012A1CB